MRRNMVLGWVLLVAVNALLYCVLVAAAAMLIGNALDIEHAAMRARIAVTR